MPETETEEDGDTTTDAYDTIADEDSEDSKEESSETEEDKSEAESHYKSIKCQDDDYSYAYKDCLSPAALIKMDNESVVSEIVYESLRNVPRAEEKDNMSTMSESMSEREDFFFSISKGRRNYLKLHKYVGWELNSVAEDKDNEQASASPLPVLNKISFKPVPEKGSIGDHSRLLPLLLEEEKKLMISENNHQKNLQMKMNNPGGLFKSYKYAQYKNVRGSKIERMIRKDQQHEKLNRNYTLSFGIKKSLRRNVSRLSIFEKKNSENRLNIKASINRKLTSILSYMKIL